MLNYIFTIFKFKDEIKCINETEKDEILASFEKGKTKEFMKKDEV